MAIILVFWCIWYHWNDVIFNEATPTAGTIRSKIKDEAERWRLARLFCSDVFWLSGAVTPLVAGRKLGPE
jgi:hypothetical protein